MAKIDQRLVDLLKKYGEDNTAVWDCHGTWVALHSAVERMAAKAKIKFDKPEMIVNDPEKKTVVVCVSASMAEASEWSFGEVSPANNKNSYPYAMAEKRAKDRVALKLLGMSGLVYSEEEADDFKASRPAMITNQKEPDEPEVKPKHVVGFREDGSRTSYALKKVTSWADLQSALNQDMLDVHSMVSFEKLKADYRKVAKEQFWNKQWLESLANEFAYYEENLKKETGDTVSDAFLVLGSRNEIDRRVQSTLEAG